MDPALWSWSDLALVLSTHDIGALFRLLGELGIGQRQIAGLIGRSQARVSNIAHGQPVLAYEVLVAIAQGLGIPPERMGLSWWARTDAGTALRAPTVERSRPPTPEEVSLAMLCRHLIAYGGIIMAGAPVAELGELLRDLGRDLWTPTPADPFGDMDRPAAWLELHRGCLDAAEQFAAASARRWKGGTLKSRTLTGIALATAHVKAGEQRGLHLAHSVITDLTKLTSVRARKQLTPLVQALENRPGSDARELARMARQVAA